MNSIKLDISGFSKRIQNIINKDVVEDVLEEVAKQAIPDIQGALVDAMYRTRLFRGLISPAGKANDPAAALGFAPDYTRLVMREMVDVIRTTNRLGIAKVQKNTIEYNFNTGTKSVLEKAFAAIQDASYQNNEFDSTWKDVTIPWMLWLITGFSDVKATIAYGHFSDTRSGRAKMIPKPRPKKEKRPDAGTVSDENGDEIPEGFQPFKPEENQSSLSTGGGWDISDEHNFAVGNNFVDDMLNDRLLSENIEQIIYKYINNVTRQKRFKIGYGPEDGITPF